MIADITNYCLLCIEIIGKNIILSPSEKSQIQENLLRVISNNVPIAQFHQIDTALHSIDDAIERWEIELTRSQLKTSQLNQANESTSQLLAAHKLIPAHASGMVPFGN